MKSHMTVSELADGLVGTLPFEKSYFERQIRRWAQQDLFGHLKRRGGGRTASQILEPMHLVMAYVFGRLTRVSGEGEILSIASRLMLSSRTSLFTADKSGTQDQEIYSGKPIVKKCMPAAAHAARMLAEGTSDGLWFYMSLDATDDEICGGPGLGKSDLGKDFQFGGIVACEDDAPFLNPLTAFSSDVLIYISLTMLSPSFYPYTAIEDDPDVPGNL